MITNTQPDEKILTEQDFNPPCEGTTVTDCTQPATWITNVVHNATGAACGRYVLQCTAHKDDSIRAEQHFMATRRSGALQCRAHSMTLQENPIIRAVPL